MAKVMVSVPDDLLARIDEEAQRTGRSRSGLLQYVMRLHLMDEVTWPRRRDNPRLKAAMDKARAVLAAHPPDPTIDSTKLIREMRDARYGDGRPSTGRRKDDA